VDNTLPPTPPSADPAGDRMQNSGTDAERWQNDKTHLLHLKVVPHLRIYAPLASSLPPLRRGFRLVVRGRVSAFVYLRVSDSSCLPRPRRRDTGIQLYEEEGWEVHVPRRLRPQHEGSAET